MYGSLIMTWKLKPDRHPADNMWKSSLQPLAPFFHCNQSRISYFRIFSLEDDAFCSNGISELASEKTTWVKPSKDTMNPSMLLEARF